MTYQSQKDADLSAALVAWTRPVDGRGESWGGFGGGVGGAAVTSCFVRFISVLASECAYICALRHLLFLLLRSHRVAVMLLALGAAMLP
jgi:hypothetical protein